MKSGSRRKSIYLNTHTRDSSVNRITPVLKTSRTKSSQFAFPVKSNDSDIDYSEKNKATLVQSNENRQITLKLPLKPKLSRPSSKNSPFVSSVKITDFNRINQQIFIHETTEEIVKLPICPEKAKTFFEKYLSEYEQNEIMQYKEIFYVCKVPKLETTEFDDEKHNLILYKEDHIAYRYEIKKLLGAGSFSQVYEAYDWKIKENVAIKVIRNKEKLHKQAKIEVSILKFIKEKSEGLPLVEVLNYFSFRSHACIIFKLLGPPLICLNQKLLDILKYSYDILSSLSFLHSYNIIHCDLKPSNILISNLEKAVLIDLGTSCIKRDQIYKYIQSRSYRAPEIVFRINYTEKIDMWSFGCILYEMCTGKILFKCEDEKDLINCISKVLGKPNEKLYLMSENYKSFSRFIQRKALTSIEELMVGVDEKLIEIVDMCLMWDSNKRLSSAEALYLVENMLKKI
ncbi:hypothetical protein SteCoe_35372 [Stentor coeruleus]|uniref:dual-specificity kinase n=1 Tax=Stentor coeruleus TaxID=5963 RepID=A0A1R2ANC5_9CILI|nr:hypothetical protein SteCoe_37259 [Stentor coeruleus]OMJ67466.1 hypothetical protein SteCoe_35372 [Stentor coeruleus]